MMFSSVLQFFVFDDIMDRDFQLSYHLFGGLAGGIDALVGGFVKYDSSFDLMRDYEYVC